MPIRKSNAARRLSTLLKSPSYLEADRDVDFLNEDGWVAQTVVDV